ncbi:MAG: methyltransferase [Holophaga sp.]|nr:methyltransferase [Holophaga sp.]
MTESRTLPDLLQALRGFQESRVLLTALELDILPAVGAGADAAAVAAKAGCDPRAAGMLLNALTALGVLVKEGDRFRCTEAARALGQERAGLMHMAHLWDTWSGLTRAVRSGSTPRFGPAGAQVEHFIAAMHTRARTITGDALRVIGAKGVRRMLDVGGGPATFAIAFAEANPELRAEVLDLAAVLPIAQGHIREAGLQDRVTVREGDLRSDDLGAGYDLVLVSAICHMLSEDGNQNLLGRCVKALAPGGRVAIREFILDPDRAGPPTAALFALNMLVGTPHGNTYTEAEYRSWLEAAGCRESFRPVPDGDWIIGQR